MKNAMKMAALALAMTFAGTLSAQNAHEAPIRYDKSDVNGVIADYDKSADLVEAALKNRLEKEGLGKAKSSKGYLLYPGVLWKSVSSDPLDVYLKVDGKKNKSTISVLVSSKSSSFVSTGGDSQTIENVKSFLNSMPAAIAAYQLSLDIRTQEETIRKAEKAYNNSIDSNKDLLKEKEKLEKKIAESNNDQVLKQKVLEEEKRKLLTLKSGLN